MRTADTAATAEATDHLLKAVIALLTVRDPQFLQHLNEIFALADIHDSKISRMTPEAWGEIRREIKIIHDFVQGDEGMTAPSQAEIKIAH